MHTKLETILTQLELRELLPLFTTQGIDDSLLVDLSDEDLQKIGVEKLGHRKKLLSAFAAPSCTDPAQATRQNPFINSLGLPFVPIGAYKVLFCIWPFRVRDFQFYSQETGAAVPACDFAQTPDHPAVNVTWKEATAIAQWLTKREHASGTIKGSLIYRLPEDREWSTAVELAAESGPTPAERSGKMKGYPWGGPFPPLRDAGNYHPSLKIDDFPETSPVGSFTPNRFGIYDLGGNVWEWCKDEYERDSPSRVLRGASCFNDDDEYLLSSHRDKGAPTLRRNNVGFRLVLAPEHAAEPWF